MVENGILKKKQVSSIILSFSTNYLPSRNKKVHPR